jgi:hypothetical protein
MPERASRGYRRYMGTRALTTLVVAVLVGGLLPTAAQAAPGSAPGDPADTLHHPYRHGAVATVGASRQTLGSTARKPKVGLNLTYGGGTGGVGVTTGAPKVYLVFWGSQWGTAGTDANGYTTLSGDAQGTAPLLQGFFKGLGNAGESWSGVMTQYCEGITAGTISCPVGSAHVGYPTGGALAGVWVDNAAPAPNQATGHDLGVEAVNAAGHFGNTSATLNRNAQYVILSPTGTHPDGFNTALSQFCAWHDYTGDPTLTGGAPGSPYGDLAFTNMPYVTDLGASCGANFVNATPNGVTDGVTMVEGHEYAETITDQLPVGGWTDRTGFENADKCAWISSGQGASQNITLTTGTYAVQSTWSNDTNNGKGSCEITHPTVT